MWTCRGQKLKLKALSTAASSAKTSGRQIADVRVKRFGKRLRMQLHPIRDVGRKDAPSKNLILEPGDFYILASRERVRVPPEFAAEMVPFDPADGEFRIHYAGFFDPGFGYGSSDIKGTRAVLEVRAHEVPFLIEHGQFVGRLNYMPLLSRPGKIYGTNIGSSYQHQALTLSKQFRREPAR